MTTQASPTRERLLRELGDAVRANQRATDLVDEAAAELMGINRTDAKFLDLLDQHGRMSAGDLARECRLTTGAVTAAIDRLERAGYARRAPDPTDRRRVLVEPTELTERLSSEMFYPMAGDARKRLAGYSDEDLELLIRFHVLGRKLQEDQAAMIRERIANRG